MLTAPTLTGQPPRTSCVPCASVVNPPPRGGGAPLDDVALAAGVTTGGVATAVAASGTAAPTATSDAGSDAGSEPQGFAPWDQRAQGAQQDPSQDQGQDQSQGRLVGPGGGSPNGISAGS